MAQENAEAIHRLLNAFNADDLDRMLAECDPEIELVSRFVRVGGVYRGHAGLRRWHQDLMDTWEYIQLELERLIEVDHKTLIALVALAGKARGSEVVTRQRIAHLDTFRAGKLTRIVTYLDRAEAIEAGGTPESTISQENVGVVRSLFAKRQPRNTDP